MNKIRLFSWNVNGLRAVLRKGALQDFLDTMQPDVLCLQEIKCKPEQVDYEFSNRKVLWNSAKRPGYSGTATLFPAHENFKLVDLPGEEDDVIVAEGRAQIVDCNQFFLVNVYVPNSKPDLSRLKLREQDWDPSLLKILKELEKTKPVVVCGDFNAAHEEIDLARPKSNHHNAGFTNEERQGITNLLNAGFVDTFRYFYPSAQRYTWWSHYANARANNVGWRIDYFFVSESLLPHLKSAEIYESITGSDHCPVSIELEF